MPASDSSVRPAQNRLVLALPQADDKRLQAEPRDVFRPHGQVLFEPRERITHVYFPQHCVVSLLTPIADEPGVEVAIVGNEGMVGLSVFLGSDVATMQAIAQIPDGARSLTVEAFRQSIARGTAFRRIMLQYTDAMVRQLARCAACNQRHRVEQRCARWLLMAHDRVGVDHFTLTQESLGKMLDVKRPTVSAAARHLQAAGAIRYSRGRVTVADRGRLERATCVCYSALVDDYARAFS
jgi:CRP-like cAMP-binding protein